MKSFISLIYLGTCHFLKSYFLSVILLLFSIHASICNSQKVFIDSECQHYQIYSLSNCVNHRKPRLNHCRIIIVTCIILIFSVINHIHNNLVKVSSQRTRYKINILRMYILLQFPMYTLLGSVSSHCNSCKKSQSLTLYNYIPIYINISLLSIRCL